MSSDNDHLISQEVRICSRHGDTEEIGYDQLQFLQPWNSGM